MPHHYAQTILQLYAQLIEAGHDEPSLVKVKQAYDFSNEIFAGLLRPNGKPFSCHTVGVTSILVSEGASIDLINAALVHTAYSHGKLRTIPASQREALLIDRLGEDVEFIIRNFHAIAWNPTTIQDLDQNLDQLSAFQKSVIILRLANELEDHLDLSLNYSQRFKSYTNQLSMYELQMSLMERLGMGQTLKDFKLAVSEMHNTLVPDSLVNQYSSSFVVNK